MALAWRREKSRTSREMDRVKNTHGRISRILGCCWRSPTWPTNVPGSGHEKAKTKKNNNDRNAGKVKKSITSRSRQKELARFSISVSIHRRRRERECAPVRGALTPMSAAMLFYVFSCRRSALFVQLCCTPAGLKFFHLAPGKSLRNGRVIRITLESTEINCWIISTRNVMNSNNNWITDAHCAI